MSPKLNVTAEMVFSALELFCKILYIPVNMPAAGVTPFEPMTAREPPLTA